MIEVFRFGVVGGLVVCAFAMFILAIIGMGITCEKTSPIHLLWMLPCFGFLFGGYVGFIIHVAGKLF